MEEVYEIDIHLLEAAVDQIVYNTPPLLKYTKQDILNMAQILKTTQIPSL